MPYTPLMSEILDKVAKAKSKDKKVELLRQYNTDALRMVLKSSFDPNIEWDLPEGDTFAPRSTLKFTEKDASVRPELVEVSKGHFVQLSRSSVKDFKKYAHLVDY